MNHGWIERIEYRAGGGRYGERAYLRIWVTDQDRARLCWVDVAATNCVLRKRDKVWWRRGTLFWQPSPLHRLVELEQLDYGKPEAL